MERKYEFTGLEREEGSSGRNVIVRQIRAVRSFGSVKEGETGGWIGMEYNLSHDGNAWVSGNASVIDDSVVRDDAVVSDNALIAEGSEISGNAVVSGAACVIAAKISGNAVVTGDAYIDSGSEIMDNAVICDNAFVEFGATVYGNTKVCHYGKVPYETGAGGNIVIDKENEYTDGSGNEVVDLLARESRNINMLRNIVNYWLLCGLPPYGFEDVAFNSPLEFREAVQGFILGDTAGLRTAIVAYVVAEEPDCLCDWIDRDRYQLNANSLPSQLYKAPSYWRGRECADPVINRENALEEVKRNGLLLRWVKEQTLEICMAAVKQNGDALQWVREQTPELCAAAMLEDLGAEKYAEWKPEYREPKDANGWVSLNEMTDAMLENIKVGRLVRCADN